MEGMSVCSPSPLRLAWGCSIHSCIIEDYLMMSGHLDTLTVFCQHETFSISIGDQFIRQDIKKKMVNSITVLQSSCLLFILHL